MSSEGRDKPAGASDGANGLLGDLESIRTLLSEEEGGAAEGENQAGADESDVEGPVSSGPDATASAEAEQDTTSARDDEVPLLDDVVSGALGVDDLAAERPSSMATDDNRSRLDDELFRVLLGEDWREAAAGILDDARAAIENHKLRWLPEDTDALNEALRVRIDETLHHWLREAVLAGMEDLRTQLLTAITEQLEVSVRQHLQGHQADEDAHGE